ncbi:MAG: DUF268 domain-containing protein [Lachnospiraceae bacterium]|nr:DUF268 domain-containing protein [Lachnospiraceae bacterium]
MKKILIWGTGKLAQQFIENQYHGEIMGFIETNRTKDTFMNKLVYGSREIPSGYDYIVVANSFVNEIYNQCLNLGIDISKMIFLYRINDRIGCTDRVVLREILLGRNYINYCMEFGLQDSALIEKDIIEYQKLNKRVNFDINEKNMWPIIRDKYDAAGTINNYFWQDIWAARHIIGSGIKKHFDIGSRLDGFIAHLLAADIEVTMIDVREFPGEVENLYTIVDDATYLHQIADESIESMSALCSLEHFGLGRYGDPIDPESCFKCFDNIQKKLKKGGNLYISVPIGKERVEFNAHRVFYASTVVESFLSLQLVEYSCAAEKKIEYNVDIYKYDNDMHNGEYRYGLFHFVKK